jgi:VCBS repeat protein
MRVILLLNIRRMTKQIFVLLTTITMLSVCFTSSAIAARSGDYDGDGKTDFVVIRNASGGLNGQLTWYIKPANGNPHTVLNWGLADDVPVQGDFDGDNRTDVAVWRAGDPAVAAFYILQSSNNTFRAELFGQTGDDPTILNDFDGDSKTDVAVYRTGVSAGQQSYFYFRGSLNNPDGAITYVPHGTTGDFPFTGYFDNDTRADFANQRDNDSQSHAVIFQKRSNSADTAFFYGLSTDLLAPGDYDGDGRTDLAVVRNEFNQLIWYISRSSDGTLISRAWGLADSDFICQGDYDGDGLTDVAIWRPNLNSERNFFYVLQSGTGTLMAAEWGMLGDYPVGNYNIH